MGKEDNNFFTGGKQHEQQFQFPIWVRKGEMVNYATRLNCFNSLYG